MSDLSTKIRRRLADPVKFSDTQWKFQVTASDVYILKWLESSVIGNIEKVELVIGGQFITEVFPGYDRIEFWEGCRLKPADLWLHPIEIYVHMKLDSDRDTPPDLIAPCDSFDFPVYRILVNLKDQYSKPRLMGAYTKEKDYNNVLMIEQGMLCKQYSL